MTTTVGWLSVQTLSITIWLIINTSMPSILVFDGALILDDFTAFIKTIILLSALSSILISFDYIKNQRLNSFEFNILILFSTLSMLFVTSSYDLISMYLAIELQSLSFYVIAAFQRNLSEKNEFATEAGLKYFVLGALSSGFLLFGESLVYGFTGITNFEELAKFLFMFPDSLMAKGITLIGLLFILIAFLFKLGAVPFHMWTPDVYEGAPTTAMAFFAITPKIAIIALLLRLCLYTFYDLIETWQIIIIICSLLSMFIGTFGALNQKKIKRLLAYSSIAHVGYLLIGLATGTIESIESLLLYITIYIPMIIATFGLFLMLQSACAPSTLKTITPLQYKFKKSPVSSLLASNPIWNIHSKDLSYRGSKLLSFTSFPGDKKENGTTHITDLSSLSKTNPLLATSVAMLFFSNAGVPPLAGFYGKFNVILDAIASSMYLVALAAVICSVLGTFYSIRLVKIIYFHRMNLRQNKRVWYKIMSKESSIIVAISFFFTIFFFLYPSFLFTITHSAALSLCV